MCKATLSLGGRASAWERGGWGSRDQERGGWGRVVGSLVTGQPGLCRCHLEEVSGQEGGRRLRITQEGIQVLQHTWEETELSGEEKGPYGGWAQTADQVRRWVGPPNSPPEHSWQRRGPSLRPSVIHPVALPRLPQVLVQPHPCPQAPRALPWHMHGGLST